MPPLRGVLCAPDKFKGSLAAAQIAAAMARGCLDAAPGVRVEECPIADGGEGSMAILVASLGGRYISRTILGPRGEEMLASFGFVDGRKLGIVELAAASGLGLLTEYQRNPMATTTFGTGQLIRAAIEEGPREIILCIGGSATVDGSCGIAQALGARFFDGEDDEITEPITGGMLGRIARIQIDGIVRDLPPIRVACDVNNPLLGEQGAARTYAPQKGATPQQVEQLEHNLSHLALLLPDADPNRPGSGAAGGAGFGVMAMLGASLQSGADLVLDTVGFDARCRRCDLVLTGEGRLDGQSLRGKACMAVARRAGILGVPTIAITGQFGEGHELCIDPHDSSKLAAAHWLNDRFGEARAMQHTQELIQALAADIVRAVGAGRR